MTVHNADLVSPSDEARAAHYVQGCVFCQIIAGESPAEVVAEDGMTLTVVPLNPVSEGHVLVIPKVHTPDAIAAPGVTGSTMASACEYAGRYQHVNLITSCGMLATQSVRHLHIHVVPRKPHDGLALPWGDNEKQSREYVHNAYLFYSGVTTGNGRDEQ